MNLIFLGKPGAGKGSQAKRICKEYGLGHLSTGDIIRDHMARNTEFGKYAKDIMARCELIPDERMIPVLQEEIRKYDSGVVLDGFPRTVPQAEAIEGKITIDKVIHIDIPEEVAIERIVGRISCKNTDCQLAYHIKYKQPKKEGICDICESALIQRNDDTKEALMNKRFPDYYNKTAPVIKYYRNKGNFIEIDGTKSFDEVFELLKRIIDSIVELNQTHDLA